MRTLGVDLAADPKRTAACRIDWSAGSVDLLGRPVDDDALVAAVAGVDLAGFDVPLGWPDGFVAAVAAHHRGDGWPPVAVEPPADRRPLRYRRTDRLAMEAGARPLSVSTDLIGVAAMRGARVQHLLAGAGVEVDRSGTAGRVAEVYPAAALRVWGLESSGYKGARRAERCRELAAAVAARCGVLAEAVAACLDGGDDDDLDAVVCAVAARAVLLGRTTAPGADDLAVARREGWIHVPTVALDAVVTDARRGRRSR